MALRAENLSTLHQTVGITSDPLPSHTPERLVLHVVMFGTRIAVNKIECSETRLD